MNTIKKLQVTLCEELRMSVFIEMTKRHMDNDNIQQVLYCHSTHALHFSQK